MKYCGTAVCMSRGKLCVDFRCTLSRAVLSVILEALLACHIKSPCVVDYVFINLPTCYNFLKNSLIFYLHDSPKQLRKGRLDPLQMIR